MPDCWWRRICAYQKNNSPIEVRTFGATFSTFLPASNDAIRRDTFKTSHAHRCQVLDLSFVFYLFGECKTKTRFSIYLSFAFSFLHISTDRRCRRWAMTRGCGGHRATQSIFISILLYFFGCCRRQLVGARSPHAIYYRN